MLLKTFRSFAFIISVFSFLSTPSLAQIGFTPLVHILEAERGQAKGLITVKNTSNARFRARVYALPFTYTRDKGFQTLDASPNDLAPYLQFAPRELIVPPNTSRRVRLVVRFPPSLPDGEYRSVLFTETLDPPETVTSQGNKLKINLRIGATIFVRKGDLAPAISVDSTSINSKHNQVFLLVRNAGTATARPKVIWQLKQGSDVISSGKLGSSTVLPQTERNLPLLKALRQTPSTSDANALTSSTNISQNAQSQLQPLPQGKYQLTGKLEWGSEDNPDTLSFALDLVVPPR